MSSSLLLHRVRSSSSSRNSIQPLLLFQQCKNRCLHHSPPFHPVEPRWRFHPLSPSNPNPTFFFYNNNCTIRCFAASVKFKSRPNQKQTPDSAAADKESKEGRRVNDEITDPFIRLVTDDGHAVVSRREALDRAKRLDLDLVEVQRAIYPDDPKKRAPCPPVCKIMDFYKEKFKSELKEKERAKNKSAVALRSGENKEVKINAQTELKDLKIKADTVTRLMERGYRVKCTALPTTKKKKKNTSSPRGKEQEDLENLIKNLLKQIADIGVIESGPHVVKELRRPTEQDHNKERQRHKGRKHHTELEDITEPECSTELPFDTKQVYVIVRHAKFGTKSGKKATTVKDYLNNVVHSVVPNTMAASRVSTRDEMPDQKEEWEHVESSSFAEDKNISKSLNQELSAPKPVFDSLKPKMEIKKEPTDVKSETVGSNRYSRRSEPLDGRFPQARSTEKTHSAPANNNPDILSPRVEKQGRWGVFSR